MSKTLCKRIGLAGAAVTLLALPAIAASPAGADTFTPTTTTDGGAGSLRQAVDDVNAAGGSNTIVLAAGATYVLDVCETEGGEDDNTEGDLDFDNGVVIIQGNGATIQQTCPGERVIDYFGDQDDGITLENLTLTGGREDDYGGGIHVDGGLTLTGVTITDNTSEEYGGGVAADSGYDVTITNSTITNNEAVDDVGGGIEADYNTFTMTGSTVADNESEFEGGGLYLDLDGEGANGAVISHSTISGNTARDGGGGGINAGQDDLLVDNSTFTGNASSEAGGAIMAEQDVRLTYVTIVSNSAVRGSNVAAQGELASFGAVIADPLGGGTNCVLESSATLGYNYEADGDDCEFTDATDVSAGADPQLGALAANGGLTETMLPADTSPLVDAIPTDDPDCRGDDQRGIIRPQFEGCDIGAVELAPAPEPTTTTTTTAPPAAAVVVPRFTG